MSFEKKLNWLFSPKCIVCGKNSEENSVFCNSCFSKITFIDYPICNICGKMLENDFSNDPICKICSEHKRYFDISRSFLLYDDASKNIVMKIKTQSDSHVANSCVNLFLNKNKFFLQDIDCITPVPSHWTRIFKRGYNPSTIIASEISKKTNIPLKKYLKRIKRTDYQKNKTIEERNRNVDSAFQAQDTVRNKSILLVDDVFTTGSTLNECAKTLKRKGANKVICFTIASTKAFT
ncbi:MAG: ComF family protein [Alphaproteobacteria bacterium]|nr:ComF family protein [Alphaproteobacteria bacterium]